MSLDNERALPFVGSWQTTLLQVVNISKYDDDGKCEVKHCNTHSCDIPSTTLQLPEEKLRRRDEHATPKKWCKQRGTQMGCVAKKEADLIE